MKARSILRMALFLAANMAMAQERLNVPEPRVSGLFDFWATYRPKSSADFAADSTKLSGEAYHYFLFMKVAPALGMEFSTHLSPTPRVFELKLRPLSWFQIRLGKIYVPFDQSEPHSLYGGRVNTSVNSHPDAPEFLPDYWADYGVALKFALVDSLDLRLSLEAYIVNGIRDGGIDPAGQVTSYPSFSEASLVSLPDNNTDKGWGGRLSAKIFEVLKLGAAAYTGRYTGNLTQNAGVVAYEGDMVLDMSPLILRGGYLGMSIGLIAPAYRMTTRGGLYGELLYLLSKKWTIAVRTGIVQYDSRLFSSADQQLIGGAIMFRSSPVGFTLTYHRDIMEVVGKTTYDYFGAGFSIQL